MALIVGYLSIVFGFKYLEKTEQIETYLIFCPNSCHALLPYLYLDYIDYSDNRISLRSLKLNYYPKRRILLLLLFVLASVAVDLSRIALTGAASGIERDISLAEATTGRRRTVQPEMVQSNKHYTLPLR